MSNTKRGTITLMGSGELADSMSRVHRQLLSRIEGPAAPVFIDTPAGFELNADEISNRAVDYFAKRFELTLEVASYKNKSRATAIEVEAALRRLRRANYMFAGPGSPSYAIRNWRGTPVWDTVRERVLGGAHLVLASAAAITTGCCALPVYEIYKAGEDPHWIPGLDLFGELGFQLAVIPHWDNSEGDNFDTRFCYMGEPRLIALEGQLDKSTVILGVDEYTACIIDLEAAECLVMGAGHATIRYRGQEWAYPSGSTFPLNQLRPDNLISPEPDSNHAAPAALEEPAAEVGAAAQATGRYLHQLAHALAEARAADVQKDLIEQVHDSVHELSSEWSESEAGSSGDFAPLLDLLLSLRNELRRANQYALADRIRDELSKLGYVIQDTPGGPVWAKREGG